MSLITSLSASTFVIISYHDTLIIGSSLANIMLWPVGQIVQSADWSASRHTAHFFVLTFGCVAGQLVHWYIWLCVSHSADWHLFTIGLQFTTEVVCGDLPYNEMIKRNDKITLVILMLMLSIDNNYYKKQSYRVAPAASNNNADVDGWIIIKQAVLVARSQNSASAAAAATH